MVLTSPVLLRSCLGFVGIAVLAVGCTSERIGSQLEFEAVGACARAIEKRLDRELPPGWQYLKEGAQWPGRHGGLGPRPG